MKFETLTVHAGQAPDPAYGAVMQPIYQVSTFAYKGVKQMGPFDYSRSGNLIRISVGIEHTDDLIVDLQQALAHV